MKKVLKTVSAIMLFGMIMLSVMPCIAEQVQPETAQRAAQSFLLINRAETDDLTDVSAEIGFSNLYIFTSTNSFVVMSADDCIQPILGYSLTRGFNTEEMPDQVRWWLQGYNDQIHYLVDNSLSSSQEVMQQWQELASGTITTNVSRIVVSPLITTTWNQGYPYNNLCPSGSWTGCAATAMAQIMKYWNYPSHGIGWHSYTPYTHPEYGELTANFNETNYDWTNMTNTYDNSSTDIQQEAVATLMYHCGISLNMDYSPTESGAADPLDELRDYFNYSSDMQYLFRSNYTDDEWIAILKSNLDQNMPIFYSGSSQESVGHAFICDGYNSNNFFHFNWGWGGYCDGYYSINNLIPNTDFNFSEYQIAVTNIRPSTNNANPTNLTYTQDERNVTLNWSAASGATSYNIYRDMGFIGNVTTTSFTEVAPYGNSVYYVRSINNMGELSLSTYSVSVTVAYPIPLVNDLSASVVCNDVNLLWTAPEWCYPATPSATLTYGSGIFEGGGGVNNNVYWGHRYPSSCLGNYANMVMYKVSFYANATGAYQLYVFQGTESDHPQTLVFQQSFLVGLEGWFDIDLSNTIQINPSQDLWVFIYDPVPRTAPLTYCIYSGEDANYFSTSNPTSWVQTWDNVAFLIRAYLTDGIYTYNIYRNGSNIANCVSNTTYFDDNLPNGSYTYYVKTNYYDGETAASNYVTVQVDSTMYSINTSCEPTNGGTVSGGGTYCQGQTCTVTANANPSYSFVNWTENGTQVSTNSTYSFTVTGNRTLVANFSYSPTGFVINATAEPSYGGLVSGAGTYNQGQTCTLIATPNPNYDFVNWTESGNVVSTSPTYSFTVNGNRTLVAHFESQVYTISVSANPSDGGTVYGGGDYSAGITCHLIAVPNNNYSFLNWTENGVAVSSESDYSFVVTGNRTLTANFIFNNGINELEDAVSVYPNPTSNIVYIEGNHLRKIEVYNAMGMLVMSETISDSHTELDLQHLSAGIYCLRIYTEDGAFSQSVVKE